MLRPFFALCARHGASKVASAIWMHGTPPNVHALSGYFELLDERKTWETYMADMTWAVAMALNPKIQAPMYSAIVRRQQVEDSRSGAEILVYVKEKIREKINAREVKKKNG